MEHDHVVRFHSLLERVETRLDGMETDCRPILGGERFMTDSEVADRLKVTRRTLQEYRNDGLVSFIRLRGKILYRESDVEEMLRRNYHEAFRK